MSYREAISDCWRIKKQLKIEISPPGGGDQVEVSDMMRRRRSCKVTKLTK